MSSGESGKGAGVTLHLPTSSASGSACIEHDDASEVASHMLSRLRGARMAGATVSPRDAQRALCDRGRAPRLCTERENAPPRLEDSSAELLLTTAPRTAARAECGARTRPAAAMAASAASGIKIAVIEQQLFHV